MRDMMTEEGHVFEVPLESRTVTVPVEMLSDSRTGLAIERDKNDFFDRYPILEYWLPGGMDASTVDMICAFMGWLDIVTECPSHQWFTDLSLARHLSEENNVRPCIAWLWLKSEHLQIHVMHDIVREASLAFYKRVAWCLVYHPDVYRQHAEIVTEACVIKIGKIVNAVANAVAANIMMNETCNEVPPARPPNDDNDEEKSVHALVGNEDDVDSDDRMSFSSANTLIQDRSSFFAEG